MNKLTLSLSLLAVATLAACGSPQVRMASSDSAAFATHDGGAAPRTGTGKVAYVVDPTGPVNGISTQRLVLHMVDGSVQVVDRRGQQIALGERVSIRSDNTIWRDRYAYRAEE